MPNGDGGNMSVVQIQGFLSGVDYPATKDELVEAARDNGAGDEVLSVLERLDDQSYETPVDVSQALSNLL